MELKDISLYMMIIVIVGITLSAGGQIFDSLETQTRVLADITNESHTPTLGEYTYNFSSTSPRLSSVTIIANQTYTVPSANYTSSGDVITFAFSPLSANAYTGVPYNVTYKIVSPTMTRATIVNSSNGAGNITQNFGTLGTAIGLGIIIFFLTFFLLSYLRGNGSE